MDKDGHEFEMEPEGVLGVCIQHEIDHLNGKLFVDHISSLKEIELNKNFKKIVADYIGLNLKIIFAGTPKLARSSATICLR